MQSLDVISVNIWNILISLANLLILFLIVKKFLFKPVRNLVANRQATIDRQYADAEEAKRAAEEDKTAWEQKLQSARAEADAILEDAADTAKHRADQIVSDAKAKADGIVERAQTEAELEKKKAAEEIKKEIVDVSSAIAQKMLEREINANDHRTMIDSFIADLGEGDDHDER